MYVCIKCKLSFPPGDTTNRQRHSPSTREKERRSRQRGEKGKKAEGENKEGEKCSSRVSEIEIPAAGRGGRGVRVLGGKLRETQTSNLLTRSLFFTHTHTHRWNPLRRGHQRTWHIKHQSPHKHTWRISCQLLSLCPHHHLHLHVCGSMRVCVCVNLYCASSVVPQFNKKLTAQAITHIKQSPQRFNSPPFTATKKREKSGKERGWNCTSKRSISLFPSLSLSLCTCVWL